MGIYIPPLHLIVHMIKHAQSCFAKGTLPLPVWKSAYFWPVLCPDGRHLAIFIIIGPLCHTPQT